MTIEMQISRVLMSETQDTHFVELREVSPAEGAAPRTFPIVIGYTEAAAIERRLLGQQLPRPQTHELLSSVIDALGHQVQSVIINDLNDHTFYAKLCLCSVANSSDCHEIDARPSDAIALGAAMQVPIFVEEHVLATASPS
ncbi:MAG: bifunctional nuclease family protein [Algisphaera sp.]